jgi:hypothetical protein
MDLLKTFITFTAGVIVSLFVLDRIQHSRAVDKAKEDAFYQVRIRALDDFRESAVTYDLSAYSAFTDLYQWRGKAKTEAMLRYEQSAFPRLRLARETVALLFPDLAGDMMLYETKTKARHDLYDAIVDTRLDGRDDTALFPDAKRAAFDTLTVETSSLRSQIVQKIASRLFPLTQ